MIIYTVGYGARGWTPEALLAEAKRRRARILDIRYSPRSARPEWDGAALLQALPERWYAPVPELGNRNYRGGGIVLADAAGGVAYAREHAAAGWKGLVLLCQCPDWQACHRRVAAELLAGELDATVEHLEPPAPTAQAGELLCLTVQPPWSECFFWSPERSPRAPKDVENRDWKQAIPAGTRLGIQASKNVTKVAYAEASAAIRSICWVTPPPLEELRGAGRLGALLGTVEVVGWVTESESPWFFGEYGLVVRDPRPLVAPWPMAGQLGFFRRELPPEVWAQLERAPAALAETEG